MNVFLAFNHQNITVIIALFFIAFTSFLSLCFLLLHFLLLCFPLFPPNSLTGGSRWTRTTDPCLIKAVL